MLPELKLALDTDPPAGYDVVVSHAHGDHIPWLASRAFSSPETADLLAIRAPQIRVTPLAWRAPTRVGSAGARVTLFPAGHILGSALTLVETPGGATLLYTGDTKTRPSKTCPTAEFPRADELIVESTFGLPIYKFPPLEDLQRSAGAWARDVLAQGEVPVFLGYALGKAQEICKMLNDEGVDVAAHGAVWNMCQAYERRGVSFPRTRAYEAGAVEGCALVVPDSAREHPMVLKLDHQIAYCSGWARLSKSRVQLDADLLLPLSDHADHEGLLDIVERVAPRKVYANHGYADVFAHMLRKRGVDAAALVVGHAESEDASPELAGSDVR